jgi:hypothetical protein
MLRYLAGMAFIYSATLYKWITRRLKGEKPSLRDLWNELRHPEEEPFS